MHFNNLCIKKYQSYSAVQEENHQPRIHSLGGIYTKRELQNILWIRYEVITSFTYSVREINAEIKVGVIIVVLATLDFSTQEFGW